MEVYCGSLGHECPSSPHPIPKRQPGWGGQAGARIWLSIPECGLGSSASVGHMEGWFLQQRMFRARKGTFSRSVVKGICMSTEARVIFTSLGFIFYLGKNPHSIVMGDKIRWSLCNTTQHLAHRKCSFNRINFSGHQGHSSEQNQGLLSWILHSGEELVQQENICCCQLMRCARKK